MPKISILCPTFNHGAYVEGFMASVLEQTEGDFELIMVDDGSGDDNVARIKKFDDPRIRLIEHDYNRGVNQALNTAFAASSGLYCVFIASDDRLRADHLALASGCLEANPEILAYYPTLRTMAPNGDPADEFQPLYLNPERLLPRYELLKGLFLRGNLLTSPGMTIRREAFERLLYPLDPSLLNYQDYAMHVRLLLDGPIYVGEERSVLYRLPSGVSGVSHQTPAAKMREEMEEEPLMNLFLNMEPETLKMIFEAELSGLGRPSAETVPYLLGRLALTSPSPAKRRWGYRTIGKIIRRPGGLDRLHETCGLTFGDYIGLVPVPAPLKDYAAGRRKYKKLFNGLLLLNIIMLAAFLINRYL